MSFTFYDDVSAASSVPPIVRSSRHYRAWGKRLFDVLAVLAIAPVAAPVLAVACAVTKSDGGRALYGQPRIGRNGRVFQCWKIRTMVPDADAVLARMIREDPAIAQEWETAQKLNDDPRITRWGRVLRRTSIDELPQLWNVLVGDMSLIGPRPFTPDQKALYDEAQTSRSYYRLRPGLSGLWQVTCRNNSEFKDRAEIDDVYAGQLSFWMDLKIAFRTAAVVMKATGK